MLQMVGFPSFSWLNNIQLCVYIYVYIRYCIFAQSSVDGHFGCFHVLAIVNNAVRNMGMQPSPPDPVFISFRGTPRREISGSNDSSVPEFLTYLCTVLHTG